MNEDITTKEISQIENFANLNAGMKLMAYDPTANKVGMLPVGSITGTAKYGGVRFSKSSASTEGEPIGEVEMIVNMRNILKLGGYLVQNDHTRRKLSPSNHFKFESGGDALLDGSMGHYQWGWGVQFYYAIWEDDDYEYEAYSTSPIKGATNFLIPVASGSRGWATMDRTNNILVSYANRNAQYRGGKNDSTYDGEWNTQCGKPCNDIAFSTFQTAAERNGTRWAANWHSWIFIVGALMRIYFHNRNIQAARNTSLTADGFPQGGLGTGVDNKAGDFGSQYGFVDCDALAEQGDAIGVFSWTVDKGDGTTLSVNNIPMFFGLINFYHYMWAPLHGVRLSTQGDKSKDVYIKKVWNSDAVATTDLTGMVKIGSIPESANGWNYPKRMNKENLCLYPLEFGGSTSTYWPDGFYGDGGTSGLRALCALGYASYGAGAGSGALAASSAPANAFVFCGAFLCEAAADWDSQGYFVG